MVRKLYTVLMLTVVIILLAGCGAYSINDLYCLPVRPDDQTNLQTVIQSAMEGMDYSAPLAGSHRRTVQEADLDGDGKAEYIVFAKNSTKMQLCVFIFSGNGEKYELVDQFSSPGSSFDRVEYFQMDDKPGLELVVGCQVSDQVVRSASVYSMTDGEVAQILNANYTEMLPCDLDEDGLTELFLLHPGDSVQGMGVLYSIHGGVMERSLEVKMSEPSESIQRLTMGRLQDGGMAIYVASSFSQGSGIITDVFTLKDGDLTNVTMSSDTDTSVQTLRNYYVYACDIDSDGVLELPCLIPMKSGDDSATASQYLIQWYAVDSEGISTAKKYTYHNYVGGWYVELDPLFADRFAVIQKGNSYEFSLWNTNYTETVKVMTIYVLTGQKREEQAVIDNRFELARTENTIFAANLEVVSTTFGMSKNSLLRSFHLIVGD